MHGHNLTYYAILFLNQDFGPKWDKVGTLYEELHDILSLVHNPLLYSLLFRIKTEQHSFPEIQLFPNQGRENKYRVITCFLFNSLFILRFPFSLSDKDEKINTGLSLVSFSIVYFYWGFLLHCQIFFLPLGFLPAFLTEGEKKNNEICRLTQTCGICKLVLSSGQDQGTWYHLNVCVTITSLAHKAQQFLSKIETSLSSETAKCALHQKPPTGPTPTRRAAENAGRASTEWKRMSKVSEREACPTHTPRECFN